MPTDAQAQMCDSQQAAKLLAADGAQEPRVYFGRSVSISGDSCLIGAWGKGANGADSGAAYAFRISEGSWVQQARLLASDSEPYDWFGYATALVGDTAIIGAPNDGDRGSKAGAAYVFTRSGNAWTQRTKLRASDGAEFDVFGTAVSASVNTVVVGAPRDGLTEVGAAYVFTGTGSSWSQQAKLVPPDGAIGDKCGGAVAIDVDTIVVGAYYDDDHGRNSGSAYVFVRNGGSWGLQAKLVPDDGARDDYFGWAVAVSGDCVLVGAYADDDRGGASGSVYVFTREQGTWSQTDKLIAGDGSSGDDFGYSVALSGDTAVIGALGDDDRGTNAGSMYVFTRQQTAWGQRAKLLASDGGPADDQFGVSVALHDDRAVCGAHQDDETVFNTGSAYIFDLHCAPCRVDLTGDGVADSLDFLLFLGAWSSGDALADWNQDGILDTRDFVAYIGEWAAGC
jgi:hypothetical protein